MTLLLGISQSTRYLITHGIITYSHSIENKETLVPVFLRGLEVSSSALNVKLTRIGRRFPSSSANNDEYNDEYLGRGFNFVTSRSSIFLSRLSFHISEFRVHWIYYRSSKTTRGEIKSY